MNTTENDLCILLAVWGEKHIDYFLQLSLASLLAPGNIPALVPHFKSVKFIFLTQSYDIEYFDEHPAIKILKNFCNVEFIIIDDLIVVGNYSTTLTFAFDRAMKSTKKKILDTYFIFLTSDYIMADGSFVGLLKYINQGYSGITAGNFQVIKSEIEPYLHKQIDPSTHSLSVSPRELLKHCFNCLHPIVIASLYQHNVTHNYLANRFFHRYDQETLAGRFYLLHMLCIKPELSNYTIGSSCDYSFIPELCPSGKVAIIDDSDDYLVVEIQDKEHELNYIDWGPYDVRRLTLALAEWTTKVHRNNSHKTIYYHTKDLNEKKKEAIDNEIGKFINDINVQLIRYPIQPYANHPYWIGALNSFNQHREHIKNIKRSDFYDINVFGETRFVKRMRDKFFGVAPEVYPWHYRFIEYLEMKKYLFNTLSKTDKTIILYDMHLHEFMNYHHWLKKHSAAHHYHMRNLFNFNEKLKEIENYFEQCIYFVRLDDLEKAKPFIKELYKILKPEAPIHVVIINEKNNYSSLIYNFPLEFANRINVFIDDRYHLEKITTIHNTPTLIGSVVIDRIQKTFGPIKSLKYAFYLLLGIPGLIYSTVANSINLLFGKKKRGHCTNILVTLKLWEVNN